MCVYVRVQYLSPSRRRSVEGHDERECYVGGWGGELAWCVQG